MKRDQNIDGELVEITVEKDVKNHPTFFGALIRLLKSKLYGQSMAPKVDRFTMKIMQFNDGVTWERKPRRWNVTLLCKQFENFTNPEIINLHNLDSMIKNESVSVSLRGKRRIFSFFRPKYYAQIYKKGEDFIGLTVNGQDIAVRTN